MNSQEQKEKLRAELQEFQLHSNLLATEFLQVLMGRPLHTGLVLRAMLIVIERLIEAQAPAERSRLLLSLEAFRQMLTAKFPDIGQVAATPPSTQLH